MCAGGEGLLGGKGALAVRLVNGEGAQGGEDTQELVFVRA